LIYGEIKSNLCVLHRCDNRKCVNPYHLFLGTWLDNVRDRDRKVRGVFLYGENHGSAKLKDQEVLAIQILHKNGVKTIDLAKRYNISRRHISRLVNLKGRIHVHSN
jgi:hypothetical protein